jgi:hypothetical protein
MHARTHARVHPHTQHTRTHTQHTRARAHAHAYIQPHCTRRSPTLTSPPPPKQVLAKLCGSIASDEGRHEIAYQRIVEKLYELDPDGAVLAFADMMRKQIVMPAHLMDDGEHGANNSGRNLFAVRARPRVCRGGGARAAVPVSKAPTSRLGASLPGARPLGVPARGREPTPPTPRARVRRTDALDALSTRAPPPRRPRRAARPSLRTSPRWRSARACTRPLTTQTSWSSWSRSGGWAPGACARGSSRVPAEGAWGLAPPGALHVPPQPLSRAAVAGVAQRAPGRQGGARSGRLAAHAALLACAAPRRPRRPPSPPQHHGAPPSAPPAPR